MKKNQKITDRSSKSFQIYQRDLYRSKPLTTEREAELSKLIQENGPASEGAFAELVEANIRFVVSVANNYTGYGLPLDILLSAGNEGLVKAAKEFDGSRGYRFISFALKYIQNEIRNEIATLRCGYRVPKIEKVRDNKWLFESADTPMGDDAEDTIGDFLLSDIFTDYCAVDESSAAYLEKIMSKCLNKNEFAVLTGLFGCFGNEVKTPDCLADELGYHRNRIYQIRDKALEKLRKVKELREAA